ncbi:MAG: hypothetical protein MJ104_03785 [Lachnospiraceae bacterium]|nr:hypothetical protein [Lachnospiraceae bacterium]
MRESFFRQNRNEIRIMVFVMAFLVGLFIFSAPIQRTRSATTIDDPDTVSRNYLEMYCGSFANAVPMAVNPTATMAVLSIVGMVERSDELWPNASWLEGPRTFLEKIPLVRNAETLPVANPWCAIIFTIMTIALYVVRSIKACKAISQETIDKVERIGGQVINVCLVLLQFTSVAIAEAAGTTVSAVRTGATVLGVVLGVIAAVLCAVVYFIVSKCIEGIEAIATGMPVAATNAVSQVAKFFVHLFATIFQFVSVYFAAIVGLIFTAICLLILIKIQKYAVYYRYIYFNPIWRKVFNKNRVIELVSKKFPRRGRKRFADAAYAIPVFSMKKYPKRLVNRELMWLIPVEGVPSLVRIRLFRRVKVYPIQEFYDQSHVLYVQKTVRFIRILTEEKDVEMIFSNEYESYLDYLRQVLGAYDFQIVLDRRAEEKRERAEAKKAAKEQAREERRRAREEKREAKRQLKAMRKEKQ